MAFVVTSIVSRLSSCATRLYNVGVVSHVNYWVFGFAIATDRPQGKRENIQKVPFARGDADL